MGFYLNKVLSHLLPVTMRRVEADRQGFSNNRGNQNRPSSGTNTSSWTNPSSGDSGNPFDNNPFHKLDPTAAADWKSAAAIWKSGWNQYENININTGKGAGVNITTSNSTTSSTTTSRSTKSSSTTANGHINNSPIGKMFTAKKNITLNEKKEVYQGGSSKF